MKFFICSTLLFAIFAAASPVLEVKRSSSMAPVSGEVAKKMLADAVTYSSDKVSVDKIAGLAIIEINKLYQQCKALNKDKLKIIAGTESFKEGDQVYLASTTGLTECINGRTYQQPEYVDLNQKKIEANTVVWELVVGRYL